MNTIFHKKPGVNFGNSILDKSNWGKTSEGITKKSIPTTERESL